MTAEIVVMNRQGVALAADSAVSIRTGSGPKIYQSANKIFALSKYRPVAVMVYSNASILGLPWEGVIKAYRSELRDKSFDTLAEYAIHFVEYLGSNQRMFPAEVQKSYVEDYVSQYFLGDLLSAIDAAGEDLLEKKGVVAPGEMSDLATKVIKRHHRIWDEAEELFGLPENAAQEVLSSYEVLILRIIRSVFKKIDLSDTVVTMLAELAVSFFTKEPPFAVNGTTGLVFVGYGAQDLFPSFVEFEIDGIACSRAIAWASRSQAVGRGENETAFVSAFAQGEMVSRFMEGVDPQYQAMIEQNLSEILSGYTAGIYKTLGQKGPSAKMRKEIDEAREAMLAEYAKTLKRKRHEAFVEGVLDAVGSLPIDRLAEMAESLVDLTSFKRKVSIEAESVGGPIDVAVITSGDGMIWIKRKHYFDATKNQQFFANYYRGG